MPEGYYLSPDCTFTINGGYFCANGQEPCDYDGTFSNNGGSIITMTAGNTNLNTRYSFVRDLEAYIQGVTRGDGVIGEDVTPNVRTIRSIPLAIPVEKSDVKVPDVLVVRGEVFMFNSDFERLNAELLAKGEKTWLNPRNTAAGSLRQQNSDITAKRPLSIFTYQILYHEGGEIPATQWGRLEYLRALGFPVSSESRHYTNFEDMLEGLDRWTDVRESIDFDYTDKDTSRQVKIKQRQ